MKCQLCAYGLRVSHSLGFIWLPSLNSCKTRLFPKCGFLLMHMEIHWRSFWKVQVMHCYSRTNLSDCPRVEHEACQQANQVVFMHMKFENLYSTSVCHSLCCHKWNVILGDDMWVSGYFSTKHDYLNVKSKVLTSSFQYDSISSFYLFINLLK